MAKTQHGRDLTPEEMAQMLDEFVNGHDDDESRKAFAEQVTLRTHRTLQQNIMRLFVATLEAWAEAPYDLRNESTVALAKKFLATGDKYDRHLPYV